MPKQDDTPLMQQWREAKSRHPDAILFFRVGDFYEMFYEDAEEGARLLGLTLTTRNNGGASDVPLAGVPARARDEYVQRLLRLGRRVAICEQVEDPAEAKGIVRREVVETVTPGVVLADALLSERRNNYVAALCRAPAGKGGGEGAGAPGFGPEGDAVPYALAVADISTGELVALYVAPAALEAELARFEPAELVLPASWEGRALPGAGRAVITTRPDWLFDRATAEDELRRRFRVHTLDGFSFQEGDDGLVMALGALVAYLAEVQPAGIAHLRPPRIERPGRVMALDAMTRRNLELVEPLRPDLAGGNTRAHTLLDVIDETVTAMGARLLRRWVLAPLIVAEEIWERQAAVAALVEDPALRRALRAELAQIRDLERLAGKAAAGRITPRELRALGTSLEHLPRIKDALLEKLDDALTRTGATLLASLARDMDTLDDVRETIARALADDPPATLADGGVIRPGYNAELDELRDARDGGKQFIASLQARERERTGIASLKVGYNKVFGYYLEVTRANLDRVPPDYERKQTLANGERYVTPELKEWEAKVLGAEERIAELEARLFGELRREVAGHVARIQDAASRIATLDVLAALAHVAERRGYVRPEVHTGYRLEIRGGRHPVVETMMPREEFIPNDIVLDEDARIMILTGPNMAGKSTLLRQVGLIQLLAQIGSFVPADAARLPVVDRIFTRVGASDNLVHGQSTFMVEMSETAAILNAATPHSLVLLDEIGRGTATYDGVSIAWAVTEYLHDVVGARTIFATHYHELTQLAELLPAVFNCNVAVREAGEDIVFLRRLEPGAADRSYGIQVGRLAGLPNAVVQRAREILRELEGTHAVAARAPAPRGERSSASREQLSLFPPEHPALVRLRRLQIEQLTPLQAMNVLAEIQSMVRDEPAA
ncbi:MAG: DNA mismatch repair protein MutS [bacterium]|jgi:DNA mismatch repair protein MutS|nr:MAG: DNA mismatch repair protein MutS [bacterium]